MIQEGSSPRPRRGRLEAVILQSYSGKCPHCGTGVRFVELNIFAYAEENTVFLDNNVDFPPPYRSMILSAYTCPVCEKAVLLLRGFLRERAFAPSPGDAVAHESFLWPRLVLRQVLPPDVPEAMREDYGEATGVLSISAKASAALSRRCLQAVLTEAGGFTQGKLADQIEAAIGTLPSYVADRLDAVRVSGNFAAHPKKNVATGDIIDVEPGEAEASLDALDLLFDHYYVKPAKAAEMKAAIDAKVAAAKKA